MRRPHAGRPLTLLAALIAAFALLAGCGGDDDSGGGSTPAGDENVTGTVSMTAVWSGDEQAKFQKVLDGFTERYPNVTVNYTSGGDQLPTILSTAVQGGNPPDLAAVAQPGLVKDFAARGAIKPIDFAEDAITQNYSQGWVDQGKVDGTLYGLYFKGANKSTVWFNPHVFNDAGVEPPANWDDFLKVAGTVKDSGVPAFSIAGADGWTLTDLFENIYLRSAGPEKYDQLANHEIPWTDPSVISALTMMKDVIGDPQNIAGGIDGALQTEFPTSVAQTFGETPKAAMVIEGDFVPTALPADANLVAGEDYDVFAFPSLGDSPDAIMGAGDQVVMFKDTPAARALVEYLATPEAAEIWVEQGGFSSPNKNVDDNAYQDDLTRETATALADAQTFRFDMSDLQPASFGATVGQGMWKDFQDFLRNPNPQATAQRLERDAVRAYK
ncbi:MAG: extracellular solute-binding protein [Thermoleophilia bacterium]|nr:extracellular solute-binding protein [Thermoleophilia bacterium]